MSPDRRLYVQFVFWICAVGLCGVALWQLWLGYWRLADMILGWL